MSDVHLWDVGTSFQTTLTEKDGDVVNIVSVVTAEVMQLRFTKPSGAVVVKDAIHTTDGSDGSIQYLSEEKFLDEIGTWTIQAYIELPAGKWSSSTDTFVVLTNLTKK